MSLKNPTLTKASRTYAAIAGKSDVRRHFSAGRCASLALRDTLVHVTDPLAVRRAFGADLSAFAACVLMVRRIDEHEMR